MVPELWSSEVEISVAEIGASLTDEKHAVALGICHPRLRSCPLNTAEITMLLQRRWCELQL